MAPSIRTIELFPQDTLLRWIEASDRDSRVKTFQIIDSLSLYYYKNSVMPTVHVFAFAHDQAGIAIFIEGFLKSHSSTPKVFAKAMNSITELRPQGDPLPRLDPQITGFTTSKATPSLSATKADTPSVTMSRQSKPAKAQRGGPSTAEQPKQRPNAAENTSGDSSDGFQDYMGRENELLEMNNKRGKTADVPDCQDCPRTPAERQLLAGKLVDAMVNYEAIVEKPIAAKTRRKSSAANQDEEASAFEDNYRVKRIKNTSKEELDILARKVLCYIKDAQEGNIFLPDRYGKQVEYTTYPTFMARYEKVLEALKFSKALVDDLMNWDHARRLVAAPDKEYQRKKMNKSGNDKKTVQLKAGIKALKETKNKPLDDKNKPLDDHTVASPASGSSPTSDDAQQAANDQLSMEATMAAEEDKGSDAMSISSTTGEDDDERSAEEKQEIIEISE
ncbi:hypothetical protein CONLIGDRAFT_673310 [Coniochaeta ligniaria NRRL 30616]|uniref:Uncharacterized protein n=1 Tax=Coniochaeta ligniaria NRRL 30616 TaxID=1408157 RepID=A0A1J7IBU3_9PEZI|nr:hypothetical protein CONLIGDRAFT_673310 [Coniochaeta ligniaria NRRL 30616]